MRKLAKQIALVWSHDDTGYLHGEIFSSSPRTGSKLIQYSEYSYEMSFQIRKRRLDQISSRRSLFHSEAKPRTGTNSKDLKSGPVLVFGFEILHQIYLNRGKDIDKTFFIPIFQLVSCVCWPCLEHRADFSQNSKISQKSITRALLPRRNFCSLSYCFVVWIRTYCRRSSPPLHSRARRLSLQPRPPRRAQMQLPWNLTRLRRKLTHY